MTASKTPRPEGNKPAQPKKDRAAEIANAFEWLITAFILAFVFRAFVMEAFRIPTGSMADTLMGAHFRLRCSECGFKFEYGFVPSFYGLAEDTIPSGPEDLGRRGQQARCPSCGYFLPPTEMVPVANGDRILVLKCIYQFQDPKRWDVVVFKNPENPTENYIKRLIGLPGDTIEIIDGDIYINGLIARKPGEVQKEVWMPVYNNDYQPVNPKVRGAFNNADQWKAPFDFGTSAWKIDPDNPTRFVLDSPSNAMNTMTYGAPSANGFNIAHAYNDARAFLRKPECSDLMVSFYVQNHLGTEGQIGVVLSKNGVNYKARMDFRGHVVLSKFNGEQETVLKSGDMSLKPGAFNLVKFANADHQVMFECGQDQLSADLGRLPDSLEQGKEPSPRASIFGSGALTLAHVAVYRDLYYTGDNRNGRAVAGNPFTLKKDQFFVLGDNSPNSHDGRWWPAPTVANRGWEPPEAGVVPRYYMVGKALFVYWPSGFEFPWPQSVKNILQQDSRNRLVQLARGLVTLRWIPNVGRMRFIYGGTKASAAPPEPQAAKPQS